MTPGRRPVLNTTGTPVPPVDRERFRLQWTPRRPQTEYSGHTSPDRASGPEVVYPCHFFRGDGGIGTGTKSLVGSPPMGPSR